MQNIPSEFDITLKNYINITSFKMRGSPDLGQADVYRHLRRQNLHIERKNITKRYSYSYKGKRKRSDSAL